MKHIFKGHWEWEYVHVLAVCMCAPVFEFVHVFCQVFGCDHEAANEELAYTIR